MSENHHQFGGQERSLINVHQLGDGGHICNVDVYGLDLGLGLGDRLGCHI